MRGIVAALGLLASLLTGSAVTAQNRPVVVELFTSQGCSTCPPADALMQELAAREDVIALAFHVDYWDYIGWRDSFASPAYTQRQHAYAYAAGVRSVYTPQFVIGGQDQVIGSREMELADAINAHRGVETGIELAVGLSGNTLTIQANCEASAVGPMTVQLIRYIGVQSVSIDRGENAGRTLDYYNTVVDWDVLTEWDGSTPLDLSVEITEDWPVVVLVQRLNAGPIVAAVELR